MDYNYTLTSKKALSDDNQTFDADISTRALSSVLLDWCDNYSPLSGCSTGSIRTLEQVSVNNSAVIFLSSL